MFISLCKRALGCALNRWIGALMLCTVLSACASYQPALDDSWMQPDPSVEALAATADMDALVAYAHAHHPQMQSAREAIAQAQAQVTAAGAFADPQLSVSQGLTDSGWQTIAIEQNIPLFQRRQIAISQAKLAVQRTQAEYLMTRNEVRKQLHTAVAEYLYVQQRILLQRDLVAILSQGMQAAQSRYQAGQAPMAEFLRAQNMYDQAQVEAINLEALSQSAQARVNSSLGRAARAQLPELPKLAQAHQQHAQLPASETALYQQLDTENVTLLANRLAVYERQAAQDLAARANRPRLMLGVEYMNTDMGDGMPAAMASVSLPIWRSAYRAERDAAAASLRASQAQWRDAQQQAHADLSMALYQWRESQRRQQLYQGNLLPRAERVVAATLNNYQIGNASYSDLAVSQQEWLDIAVNHQRALADQWIASAAIYALTVGATALKVPYE